MGEFIGIGKLYIWVIGMLFTTFVNNHILNKKQYKERIKDDSSC